MTVNTSDSMFKYFQDLLEHNKLKFLKDSSIEKMKETYGSLITSVDEKKGIIQYWGVFSDQHSNGETIEAVVTYDFSKKFPQEVYREAELLKNSIDKAVVEINYNGVNANEFLNTQANELTSLIEKSKVVYPKLIFIEKYLIEVLSYLVAKYSLKQSFNKQSKIDLSKSSYFEANTKYSTLTKLYDEAIELGILDDNKVSEEIFINVLSGNPTNTDEVIIFKCNNQLAVHFINCIKPLFNNLTLSQISKSKSFYNKQGKAFNLDDLSNASTRLKKNTSTKIDKFTLHFSRIVKGKK